MTEVHKGLTEKDVHKGLTETEVHKGLTKWDYEEERCSSGFDIRTSVKKSFS